MNRRTGRGALYLCVALLGVIALNTTAAHASSWMVKGAELKEGILPKFLVSGHGHIAFNKFGLSVRILCTGNGTVGAHLVVGVPLVRFLASLRSLNCTFNVTVGGKEEVVAACKPKVGTESGVIVSKEAEGTLTLSGGVGVGIIKPKTGTTLAIIETGPECAYGEEIPIIGTFSVKDSGGTAGMEKEAKVHTVEEGPGTEMWAYSKAAENKATIAGMFKVELESGELWSGLPG